MKNHIRSGILTQDEMEFILLGYLSKSSKELASQLHRTPSLVQRFLRQIDHRKSIWANATWSNQSLVILTMLYPVMRNSEIAGILEKKPAAIDAKAYKLGLRTQPELLLEWSKSGRFKKGHTSSNKGSKMPAELKDRISHTFFKNGHLPHNTKHDGCITVRHNHKKRPGRPYKWIRIASGNWKLYHVYVWENKNGPVPKGHIVVFKDGDTMNCSISNLKCITRKEHAANTRNTDGYIANLIAVSAVGSKSPDRRSLAKTLENETDLLNIKRKQLKFNQKIREHEKANTRRTEVEDGQDLDVPVE